MLSKLGNLLRNCVYFTVYFLFFSTPMVIGLILGTIYLPFMIIIVSIINFKTLRERFRKQEYEYFALRVLLIFLISSLVVGVAALALGQIYNAKNLVITYFVFSAPLLISIAFVYSFCVIFIPNTTVAIRMKSFVDSMKSLPGVW